MMRISLSLLTLLSAASAVAESSQPFGFAPPELSLAEYNAMDLHAGDFNEDGRLDLVFLNPDRGRIDLLLQQEEGAKAPTKPTLHKDRWQPVLSHPRFQTESLIPDNPPNALTSGDFNRDGHQDLALTNDQNQLQLYLGPLQADWQPFTRLDLEPAPGSSGRMAWDKETGCITLLRKDHIQEVRWNKKSKSFSVKTVGAPPPDDSPTNLFFQDVDGDGLRDVLYQLRDKRFNLAVHLRNKKGLGQLTRPAMDPHVSLLEPAPGGQSDLLGLHARSGTLLTFSFITDNDEEEWDSPDLLTLQLPRTPNLQPHWTDLNGDKEDDLLLISSSRGEILHLPSGNNVDAQTPISYPLPVAADWILEGRLLSGGKASFLLHDGDSGYLGLTHYEDDRLKTPVLIPNTDNILTAAVWPGGKNKSDEVAAIIRNEDRTYSFKHWRLEKDDEGRITLNTLQELALTEVKRNIGQLLYLPVPEAPVPTLVATSPLGDAFFLQQNEEGIFEVQPAAPGFSNSLLERLSPENLWLAPKGSPFPTRWILYKQNRVHFIKLGRDGLVEVNEQINLSSSTEPMGIVPVDAKGRELAVLTANGRRLEIHQRKANGLYAYNRDAELPPLQPSHIRLFKTRKGEFGLRILGRKQLAVLYPKAPKLRTQSRSLYETDLPNMRPDRIITADFNGDKRQDIALVDSMIQNAIEFLEKQEDNRWTSRMHFQLFETSPGSAGRRGGNMEPRETLVEDIDGDGLDDLVLLMHDRVLFYRQDPVPDAP